MNANMRRFRLGQTFAGYLPVLTLLNPGRLAPATAVAAVIGLAAAWALSRFWGFPLWTMTLTVLLALLPVGILKWRDDRLRYGGTVMLLSIILVAQGIHTIEHIVQLVQYYVLYLPARRSNGLLSAANAEWVHFVWNWAVLLVVLALLRGGVRNWWALVLLAVTVAHTVEHTYMFARHLQVLDELYRLDVYTVRAQGLAGILGRDGWLARSPLTQNTFLCSLPGLTTAMRLDVHFWWNVIEMALLLAAGTVFLRGRMPRVG